MDFTKSTLKKRKIDRITEFREEPSTSWNISNKDHITIDYEKKAPKKGGFQMKKTISPSPELNNEDLAPSVFPRKQETDPHPKKPRIKPEPIIEEEEEEEEEEPQKQQQQQLYCQPSTSAAAITREQERKAVNFLDVANDKEKQQQLDPFLVHIGRGVTIELKEFRGSYYVGFARTSPATNEIRNRFNIPIELVKSFKIGMDTMFKYISK